MMEFVIIKPGTQEEKILFSKIDAGARELQKKLRQTDFTTAGISEYNQRYLTGYLKNYRFYLQLYTQVLITAIRSHNMPVEETVFIDYGGGSGIFSFLAKMAGFKEVVYNDIYDVSARDATILSELLDINVSRFVCGDIDVLAESLRKNKIQAGLMCSFDVLEHIYNLEGWFQKAGSIGEKLTLVFSSSANIRNPFIRHRLRKVHRIAESEGKKMEWGSKKRDSLAPFFEIRKTIIREIAPELNETQITDLSRKTRGMNRPDIEKAVGGFLHFNQEIPAIGDPTNTCDPLTGNWSEHLIKHNYLKKVVLQSGFAEAKIEGSLYSFSGQKKADTIKRGLNLLHRISGKSGILISPLYILIAKK